jgi:hypothetical protein
MSVFVISSHTYCHVTVTSNAERLQQANLDRRRVGSEAWQSIGAYVNSANFIIQPLDGDYEYKIIGYNHHDSSWHISIEKFEDDGTVATSYFDDGGGSDHDYNDLIVRCERGSRGFVA